MDGKRSYNELESLIEESNGTTSLLSVEQLQRLVRLLDHSAVSEVELKRAEAGIRLVLRKTMVSESNMQRGGANANAQLIDGQYMEPALAAPPIETKHSISAHFVGVFRASTKPKRRPLVALGDTIKVGQLVATIESLNVFNEVESSVAGQVVEILVQDGQAVEYGQQLMIIESAVGEA